MGELTSEGCAPSGLTNTDRFLFDMRSDSSFPVVTTVTDKIAEQAVQ